MLERTHTWALCAMLVAGFFAASLGAMQGERWHAPDRANQAFVPFAAAQARRLLIVAVAGRPAPRLAIGRVDPQARVPDITAADLASDLGRRLGVPVEMIPATPEIARDALRAGSVDVAIANLHYERDSSIAYVPTAYGGRSGSALVLRKGGLNGWTSLRGKPVCVTDGSPYARTLRTREKAVIVSFAAATEALFAFERGDCSAVVDDEETLAAVLKLPQWRYYTALPELASDPVFIAFPKREGASEGNDATLAWLDRAVRAWRREKLPEHSRKKVADLIGFDVALEQSDVNCH